MRDLLAVYDTLPDLLNMAHERKESLTDDVYAIQDSLRAEYRRNGLAFHWSMPFRSVFYCQRCRQLAGTEMVHELENPMVADRESPLHCVKLSEAEVHNVRLHGGSFSEECQAFLSHVVDEER